MDSSEESSETALLLPANPNAVPKDRLRIVYAIFYLLGIGTLLPWNFFSNAKVYFMFKLRNTSVPFIETDNGTTVENLNELQIMFESYLSVAAMLPGVLFMFLNTAATKLIRLKIRMVLAAVVMIILFGLTIVLVRVSTDSWQVRFLAVTLVTIVIMNAGSAVLQGGIFGLSSMFPQEYTQAVMGGMVRLVAVMAVGMGGTLASIAYLLAIAVSSSPQDVGFGYFMTAEIVVILALIGYLCLPLLKFARYHTGKTMAASCINKNNLAKEKAEEKHSPKHVNRDVPLLSVFKKLWVYGLSVFFIFAVTLSCYPAILSGLKSSFPAGQPWADKYFTPVTCFLVFNVGDLFGRTAAGWFQWPREGSVFLPIFSAMRLVFIPLFMLCNYEPRYHFPIFFYHDAFPICFVIVFAVSNGYLGTLCMMYGPRRVPLDDIETAGSMMSFFLSLGLGVGSLFSFVLLKVV